MDQGRVIPFPVKAALMRHWRNARAQQTPDARVRCWLHYSRMLLSAQSVALPVRY